MNLFELAAKLTLDSSQYEKGIKSASDSANSIGGKIGGALKTVGKISAAAVGAAATGIGAIVKQSVDAYGNYEQLAGGIETLFGDAAGKVLADSQAAFKTAGMSMNEYMETSIQSAASLINALDGDQSKAADLMNMSITDMADNVNKMGTTMEAVQNAYRGFSRGNFTMLDNLALGFAGTKEGMQQLLDKAKEISGVKYDISSYADIVEAIHVVQTEMKISGISAQEAAKLVADGVLTEEEALEKMGTTAKEAATTLQGSFNSAKAAWQNLVTGLSNPDADIGSLVDDMLVSAGIAINNLLPIVEKALSSVGTAIKIIAPKLIETFSGLIKDVLPELIQSALSLLESIGSAIIDNIDTIIDVVLQIVDTVANALFDNVDNIIGAVFEVIKKLGKAIIKNAPVAIEAVFEILDDIVEILADPEILGGLVDGAISIIEAIANGLIENLPVLIPAVIDIILTLAEKLVDPNNITVLMGAATDIILALIDGIMAALPDLIARAPELIMDFAMAIINMKVQLFQAGVKILGELILGIASVFENLTQNGREIVQKVWDGVKQRIEEAKNWGRDLIQNFISGITAKWQALKEKVSGIASGIKSLIGFSEPEEGPLSDFHTYAPDMMDLFAKGVTDNAGMLHSKIAKAFDFSDAATMPEMTYSVTGTESRTEQNNDSVILNAILARLASIEAYLPNLGNITLDGEVISTNVDNRLGRTAAMKARV